MKMYIEKCLAGENLTASEAADALGTILEGRATDVQIAALLVALRAKGETVDELVGFATTMREKAVRIRLDDPLAVDMCGTGGDGLGTFNISTVAALVTAGAGVTVAKHGNRSVSSRSGSADVLTALGVQVQIPPRSVEECVNRVGIGFLFAPSFHPAMRSVARPRTELGIRTIFNMLGPITNPGGVRHQLVGAYDAGVGGRIAGALRRLGTEKACVVHGEGGMDEVTVTGPTRVFEVDGEKPLRDYTVTATRFAGIPVTENGIQGGGPEENAQIALHILRNERHAGRGIVVANAGFGIYVSGTVGTLEEGVEKAEEAVASGRALDILEKLVEFTKAA